MNNIKKYTALLGAGAIMITLATGCADKNNNAVPDAAGNVGDAMGNTTSNVADAMGNTAGNMADAAGNTTDAMGNAASNATTAVAQGADNAGTAIAGAGDALTYTPKIKTALGAQPALKGSNINVDTNGPKKVISLTGTVTSAAQKTMAEAIAKKNGPANFKVDNQLKMAGGKM